MRFSGMPHRPKPAKKKIVREKEGGALGTSNQELGAIGDVPDAVVDVVVDLAAAPSCGELATHNLQKLFK
jgi:hypothetical protein